jgi:hypothetical protein
MELGGSDAFIVLEDAEIDKTVEWAVWGRMNNTGNAVLPQNASLSSIRLPTNL